MNPSSAPVYELELDGLVGELTTPGRMAATEDGTPRVVMLMCHAERDAVARYLADEGFVEVHDIRATLRAFARNHRLGPAAVNQGQEADRLALRIVARLELVAQLMDASPELGQVVG